MDERLERALEFANYRITLSNQKRNIRTRMQILQTLHYSKGSFLADPITIGFVSALLSVGKTKGVIVDTKDNPIMIEDLDDFRANLIEKYSEASNEYKIQIDKVNKSRNIKKLMDW